MKPSSASSTVDHTKPSSMPKTDCSSHISFEQDKSSPTENLELHPYFPIGGQLPQPNQFEPHTGEDGESGGKASIEPKYVIEHAAHEQLTTEESQQQYGASEVVNSHLQPRLELAEDQPLPKFEIPNKEHHSSPVSDKTQAQKCPPNRRHDSRPPLSNSQDAPVPATAASPECSAQEELQVPMSSGGCTLETQGHQRPPYSTGTSLVLEIPGGNYVHPETPDDDDSSLGRERPPRRHCSPLQFSSPYVETSEASSPTIATNDQELYEYMNSHQAVLYLSKRNFYQSISRATEERTVQYKQEGSQYAGILHEPPSTDQVIVTACDDSLCHILVRAQFLPFEENKATLLRLDSTRGKWFFTDPLSGCEVWIATRDESEPIIFHINANQCKDKEQSLKEKEKMARQALAYVNRQYPGCQFRYRIIYIRHYKQGPERRNLQIYVEDFMDHFPDVRVGGCDDAGIFYGECVSSATGSMNSLQYSNWKFQIKPCFGGEHFEIGKNLSDKLKEENSLPVYMQPQRKEELPSASRRWVPKTRVCRPRQVEANENSDTDQPDRSDQSEKDRDCSIQ